jgi:4-aminobutyrate aminotransferase-like enzyme
MLIDQSHSNPGAGSQEPEASWWTDRQFREEGGFTEKLYRARRGWSGRRRGMAANTIRIKPPFCVTKADIDFIIKTLDEAFSIIEKG